MEHAQAFASTKNLLAQGQLEQGLEELVVLLDSNPAFAELVQAVRVNQADFFQVKSQGLRGTIAPDEARRAYNQITDRALEIVKRVEAGKTTLFDPAPARPKKGGSWVYYILGLVLVSGLAFAGWQFFGAKEDCPAYGRNKTLRVMILPFKKIENGNHAEREYEIMDGLNRAFESDFKMSSIAEADVNDAYDINTNYPNPSEALELAKSCGVEMIVWGRKRLTSDTVDVQYRLVSPLRKQLVATRDSALNQLLSLSEEGAWSVGYKQAIQLLYLVAASQSGASPMAMNVLQSLPETKNRALSSPMADSASAVLATPLADESTLLLKADLLRQTNKIEEAIALYDQVLTYNPQNTTALRIRGALLYAKGDYIAASRDLEGLSPNDSSVSPALLQIRADAHLQAGNPEKARKDIDKYSKQKEGAKDLNWLQYKQQQVADSIANLERRVQEMERIAKSNPKNVKARLGAAKGYLALGDTDAAIKSAERVQKLQPQNSEAVNVQVEAFLEKGDTTRAVGVLQRSGMTTRSGKFSPQVQRLQTAQ